MLALNGREHGLNRKSRGVGGLPLSLNRGWDGPAIFFACELFHV
jgi:hypothetical protein